MNSEMPEKAQKPNIESTERSQNDFPEPVAVSTTSSNTSTESKHDGSFLKKIMQRLSAPLPVVQPRLRFEMPPENDPEPFVDDKEADSSGSFSTRTVSQHPIFIGFMGAVGVGGALGLFFMFTSIQQLLVWILTALFIALGLDPVVRWLESRKVPRAAGILVALAVLVGIVTAFFAMLIPIIVEQTTQLVDKAPTWINDFLNSDLFVNADSQFHVRDRISEEVNKFFTNSQAVGGIFGGVVGIGATIANGLFGTLIVLVLSLYFLASLPALKSWSYRLAPKSRRANVEKLSEQITSGVGNYVIGQVCVAVLNAGIAFTLMSILHIPFSVLLAFLVALLAFIPLVGSLIAGISVTLVALTLGWQSGLIYGICYFAYLQVEAYIISPRIMQKAVAVPGSVAVISVIAGGSMLGILGALIAIPTAAAVMLLIREVFIVRQDKM